jgi:hypothetical protein
MALIDDELAGAMFNITCSKFPWICCQICRLIHHRWLYYRRATTTDDAQLVLYRYLLSDSLPNIMGFAEGLFTHLTLAENSRTRSKISAIVSCSPSSIPRARHLLTNKVHNFWKPSMGSRLSAHFPDNPTSSFSIVSVWTAHSAHSTYSFAFGVGWQWFWIA